MNLDSILSFCKCNGTQICPGCKILTALAVVGLTGILLYVFVRKKRHSSDSK